MYFALFAAFYALNSLERPLKRMLRKEVGTSTCIYSQTCTVRAKMTDFSWSNIYLCTDTPLRVSALAVKRADKWFCLTSSRKKPIISHCRADAVLTVCIPVEPKKHTQWSGIMSKTHKIWKPSGNRTILLFSILAWKDFFLEIISICYPENCE